MSTGFGGPPNNSTGLAQNGIQIPLATETTPGLMSADDKTKLDALAFVDADWPLATVRYFALDYDGGSDTNVGYSDVDMATAGTVARKTWQGLQLILPTIGAGRLAVVAIKPRAAGATYLETDGITAATMNVRDYQGYAALHIVATTDFSNTATDKIKSGGITSVAGPGASGEWTCAAGATVNTFTVSAGTLPITTAPLIKRVRFTGNITAGLANRCGMVFSTTAAVVVVGNDLNLAPANGDTFFIEEPGVVFAAVSGIGIGPSIVFRGIATTGTWLINGNAETAVSCVFCESRSGTSTFTALLQTIHTRTYTDIVSGSSLCGTGFRASAGYTLSFTWNLAGDCSGSVGGSFRVRTCAGGNYGVACLFKNTSGILVQQSGFAPPRGYTDGNPNFGIIIGNGGNTSGLQTCTVDGGGFINWQDTNGQIGPCVIQNAGANPGVQITGGFLAVKFISVTGSTGNTTYGVNLNTGNAASQGRFAFSACTCTGTLGDILAGGGGIVDYADLLLTNVFDSTSNELIGTAGRIIDGAIAVTNKAGAALAVGDQVRSNGTSGQVTSATGNSATIGDSSHIGVMVSSPADNGIGYMAGPGYAYCLFDGAPTIGAIAYLSPGTVRKLTTTVPAVAANNNKLRVGRVVSSSGGSTGVTRISPENLAIVADGAA